MNKILFFAGLILGAWVLFSGGAFAHPPQGDAYQWDLRGDVHHHGDLMGMVDQNYRSPNGKIFSVVMEGENEVPPGDKDGEGTAHFRLRPGKWQICSHLLVDNIASASAAHIHYGSASFAGPIVITLPAPADGDSMSCVQSTKNIIKDIRKNPENYYVNVHNSAFPSGAIRGQLGW